ncbi:SZT2 [Acanthosepion pharaonis]|uniref:SZT2 n=1 Tax=Acanthosepion pharaonis TaxID=158019 RepID=A0A812CFE5_ACAPH|nr:SZT2 [Sepia pharaonis]
MGHFYDIDYEAISCLTTFEQLIHLCQCRPDNAYHAQSQQLHQQHRQHLPSCLPGINKFSSTEKCTPDMENCPHLDNNVTTIPFPYNLMGILPRCQQAEMLFSGYTVNRSIYSGDNWKIPNSVLFEIFLEKLKTSHGQEIWLSSEECQKFTDLLLSRKNEQTMSASSLIADNRPVNEETGIKTETSSKSPGIPLDTPQSENTLDDILFSTDTSQSVGPTKWRCFIQDINSSHMFLTFVPASFEDLRTLKPGIHTATLHDNLEIVAVNEWNPSVQKTKPQVYEEIITGPSPVDEKSVLEFVSNPSKSSSSSSRNQENSATDPNQNSSSQQVVTPSLTPHSIPTSPGICNVSPSFTQQNFKPCSNLPSPQPNSFPATNGILPSPGLQAEASSPNQPHCVSTSAQSITEASSSNLPPDIENDNSLFQEKEYFILPVYIYDCSLSKIIDSLVHKGAFTLPPDIVEDHTIGDNLFHEYDLGVGKSQTPNNLDIHDDSSEGGRHSTASLDRRSNDSISDHPGDFKKHREKVTDVFSSSYVIGIFRNLSDEHYVDKMDIDTAIDICEESPPLEINIVQFLHASCGHLRHVCSKQKKYDEEGATSYFCDDSPRKSAVRFSDRNESYYDSPHLFTEPNISDSKSFQLPSIKVPIPLSPMDEGRTCEYVSELHQIISHKFADTMSTWFKPVPSCPDYYFFCPDPVTVNNNVPGRTGDMSEEQIGTTNESISHSCTTAEDTDIVLDLSGPELNTANKFPVLTTIDPSNSDSDDHSMSSSGVESSDADDPCHPLFISFICTLKQNTDHHNIVVGTIPTCLAEITGHLMDKLSELDLGNLQVTFDLYCLTLPLEMDHLPKKFPFIGFADADDDDSSPDGFQKRDPFSFLPKYQHDAIMDCKQEIEWLMRDEIVCALRYVYPIKEDKLQMVTEHVQESFQLGKTSCYIEEVTPQFVFGSDQSLSRFLDELQRVNIKDYRFKKEGSFFYLVLTRAMAAHFLALSSAVCSLDDTNQTPEKTTKKSTPDDSRGKLAVPQKILSRCISDSCQDWRDSSGKSGLDGREAADVSIQLTNEEGLKEVCPLSPERVAIFDAEGCRKVQHHTIASSDKYLSTMAPVSVSSTPAVAAAAVVPSGASGMTVKHLTSSPMAHLTCRARHSSAPTAAQKNVTGASSQPSTMPATPSWISSRGSFTEEAGYDGDSSDGDYNNDDGAFFNETGGQRSSMPNFWLVMRVEPKKVTLYYHVRGQKDSSINQRGKQLLKDVSDVIMDTCKKVNQLFLLQDLFTMRMCNVLLVPEADEDICWTKDRYTVPTGMQALRSVLSKLSVNNRKNMFVMKDGLGNYFYVRLDECKISSTSLAEDVTNGRQDFDSYPDCSTISPISTPKRDDDDDEESSKSLRDVDTLSISSMGSYVSKRSEDYIKVSMHGITPAGDEMTEDLRKMLQNKLDDTVLDIISVMLDRNPKCKLNFEDVRFIQRHKEAPKDTIYVTIPNGSLQQLFPLCYYLKQNLLQFVHVPNYVDNHPTKHFIDYASSEPQELKENQVFLYHRPSSSGGKGIACIAMAFVDSRDQEVKFIGCQKPPSLPYDEMVPPEEYPTLIETYLLEELPPHTSKPGLARFIRFRIWERGNVDLPSLKKKLVTSVKHALCDVFADSLWNISTTTTDGSSGGQQHKNSELRNMLLQYESGEKGFLHSVFWTSLPRWFDFCHTLGVPAVNKMELELQARFSVDFLLRELPTQFANITRDINLKVFKLSKLGNLDTSFDVDWDNKVSPGKQQQFVVVGRNVEQWSSCVDHYDGRDCPDDSPSSHTSRVSHRELRFSPYLPSGSSTNLENSPTDKYHTLFVPRQHLLLLLINDKTMTFYSYNVAGDMTSGFKKLLRNMVHWQNARAHVLDCVVVQKMGLYHHQPFGESLPIKQNPFTQSNMDIDMLVMKTYLPKDVTKRNNSMISAGMPYCPQMMGILRPFDEIYRNLKPAQPLHHSPYNNKYDVVLRHGQQAQEIRNNYRKDMDKVLKLRELHSMWFSKNFASISEDIIHLLKQSSRLLHYCATPLLFSPAWRREVLKRVPSKKPEPTPSPVIQEKTDVKVRSRHSSGASIASLLSKRHDSSQEGKKKDRHSQDCTDSPQQRPASLDSPQEEEDWHREIRKKFLQQYMQHLQSLGFVQIQTRPASPKRINGRGNLRKLASEGGRTVRDECDQGKKEVYDMQKTLSGGMILVELNFCDQHYYVKLYGYDCSRMGANVNSQNRFFSLFLKFFSLLLSSFYLFLLSLSFFLFTFSFFSSFLSFVFHLFFPFVFFLFLFFSFLLHFSGLDKKVFFFCMKRYFFFSFLLSLPFPLSFLSLFLSPFLSPFSTLLFSLPFPLSFSLSLFLLFLSLSNILFLSPFSLNRNPFHSPFLSPFSTLLFSLPFLFSLHLSKFPLYFSLGFNVLFFLPFPLFFLPFPLCFLPFPLLSLSFPFSLLSLSFPFSLLSLSFPFSLLSLSFPFSLPSLSFLILSLSLLSLFLSFLSPFSLFSYPFSLPSLSFLILSLFFFLLFFFLFLSFFPCLIKRHFVFFLLNLFVSFLHPQPLCLM